MLHIGAEVIFPRHLLQQQRNKTAATTTSGTQRVYSLHPGDWDVSEVVARVVDAAVVAVNAGSDGRAGVAIGVAGGGGGGVVVVVEWAGPAGRVPSAFDESSSAYLALNQGAGAKAEGVA